MGPYILFFMAGVITVLIMISSGLAVIGIAYQRIIKPLIMIPFSTIVLGMSCCSDEGSKMMWSIGKTFLGFCISGAFMMLALYMGSLISTELLGDVVGSVENDISVGIVTIVRFNMGALIITGLLKSMDAMVQKSFG